MTAFLTGVPRWAWFAIGGVVLLLAFYLMLDAYGDSRFREGKDKADAAWKAASEKLIEDAQASGKKADTAAAARAADYAARVEDEKEKIDAAVAEGSSPWDAMFGNGSR